MANETHLNRPALTGSTLYVVAWNQAGQAWNGSAYATYTATRATWDIAATEVAAGTGKFTAPLPADVYAWEWFLQAGGSPSHDNDISLREGSIDRANDSSGNAIAPASATSGIDTKIGTPSVSLAADIATRASQTSVDGVPTNAEFAAAFPSNFAAMGINASGHVSRVTLTDTTTTNTDMRGTDGANTTAPDNAGIAAVKAKTDNLPSDPADASAVADQFSALATDLNEGLQDVAESVDAVEASVGLVKTQTDQLVFVDNKVNANAEAMVDEQAIIDGVVAGVGSGGGPAGLTEEQAMQLDLAHAAVTNGTYGAAATKTTLDAVAASASAAASSAATAATQASGANTKAANIQTRIPSELEDGKMKSTGEFELTPEQIEELKDGLVLAGVGIVITPVNQVAVPASREWILKQTSDGLKGESRISITLSDVGKVYAINFRADLPVNGRCVEILEVEVVSGDPAGLTLGADLEAVADYGVDRSQAKVRITPVTSGTYVLGVRVQLANDQGGGESYGEVTLKVR
jgi:hypothetical protein